MGNCNYNSKNNEYNERMFVMQCVLNSGFDDASIYNNDVK